MRPITFDTPRLRCCAPASNNADRLGFRRQDDIRTRRPDTPGPQPAVGVPVLDALETTTSRLKSNLRLIPAFHGIWYGITPVALMNQISSKRMKFASTAPIRPDPSIIRRSRSSTMRWHSAVASTSPSAGGIPPCMSIAVAVVGCSGAAAMRRDTRSQPQLTVRRRAHSCASSESMADRDGSIVGAG
jgi:hypothetical protein